MKRNHPEGNRTQIMRIRDIHHSNILQVTYLHLLLHQQVFLLLDPLLALCVPLNLISQLLFLISKQSIHRRVLPAPQCHGVKLNRITVLLNNVRSEELSYRTKVVRNNGNTEQRSYGTTVVRNNGRTEQWSYGTMVVRNKGCTE